MKMKAKKKTTTSKKILTKKNKKGIKKNASNKRKP